MAATCGTKLRNLGTRRNQAELLDARLYLSNIRLITADGTEVPLMLTADGKWQSDQVALLDFENATGLCKDGGTAETNTIVSGTLPAGTYSGIVFNVGVPAELNHADVATAQAPLNVAALWWNWQYGYKFARIDLRTNAPAPDNTWFTHLGSTGCGELSAEERAGKTMTETMQLEMAMGNRPPESPCKNSNMLQIRLGKFDAGRNQIVLDLATLFSRVNLAQSKPMPPGCMSGIDDPDCTGLFPNLGLVLATGDCLKDCSAQKMFRVEARKP